GDGEYLAQVERTASPSMATFYTNVLASEYVDWLAEYATPTQSIGRGSFVGQYRIQPSTSATVLDNADVIAELAAQITSGNLPPRTADTLYVVFFPRGFTITIGSDATSCVEVCG